jgi:hypothetical protein
MLAVNILIPSSSANFYASGITRTSNASIVANSFLDLSLAFALQAFNTSFLWIGPILTLVTGIFICFKNSSNASREPIVEA